MLRAGYSFVLWLAFPLLAFRLWVRSRREPGYSRGLAERFGAYKIDANAPLIWVHAVSVGEVRASMPLVTALRQSYPSHGLLLTCMTAAGRDAIHQAYGESVLSAFLPYDYPFAVRRFLDRFQPRLGVLMETEIWINLLAECRRRSLPVVLANARMSSKSARGYHRLSALTRPAFESLCAVCAQSESDANRIASLGAHHVSISGNLKFEVRPESRLVAAGAELKRAFGQRKALVIASTREGEEPLLLEALRGSVTGDLLVILVPRHPQRFEAVAALLAEKGFSFARRSRGESASEKTVLLGDTMGEMPTYYAAADVAVIGGSFLPYGGQNLIEACAVGVPVVIGPHAYNFSEATLAAVQLGAAIQVAGPGEAIRSALALLVDPVRCKIMGKAGRDFCDMHRGATARHMKAIHELLPFEARPQGTILTEN